LTLLKKTNLIGIFRDPQTAKKPSRYYDMDQLDLNSTTLSVIEKWLNEKLNNGGQLNTSSFDAAKVGALLGGNNKPS
jgi:hypothetical protein